MRCYKTVGAHKENPTMKAGRYYARVQARSEMLHTYPETKKHKTVDPHSSLMHDRASSARARFWAAG